MSASWRHEAQLPPQALGLPAGPPSAPSISTRIATMTSSSAPGPSPKRTNPPPFLHTSHKSTAAPPNLDTDPVELKDMIASTPPPELALKDDIHKLAIHGDEVAIRALLDSGKAKATDADAEGVTPLHWAAINNRYAVVKLLLDQGADPNAHGGESDATPAMWAAQRSHYYVVHHLLTRGADPTLVDSSGYNLLHLATFDGNIFLLVLLLHRGLAVDSRDPNDHTALMWAAYKGFPACVDLFLREGADIHAVDDTGFSALHWALVRGNYQCIQKLLEYGIDRFSANNEGKTPSMVAKELKSEKAWFDALEECGYDREGNPLHAPNTVFGVHVQDKDAVLRRFFFLWPAVEIWAVVQCLGWFQWLAGILSAAAVGAGLHMIAVRALSWTAPGLKAIHRTPYLAGIFAGTAFWTAATYLLRILPATLTTVPLSNLLFAAVFSACIYFYTIAFLADPGYIPKLSSVEEQRQVIDTLLADWKYDADNFCTSCMARMSLRSKHCRPCGRCVAKHDHHCPWIANCVGVANHRQFVLFVVALEVGILLYLRVAFVYFSTLSGSFPECAVLSPRLCEVVSADPWSVFITIWAALQATWVTMLLSVQLLQIAKAVTTYESMHASSHSHHKLASAVTTAVVAGATSTTSAALEAANRGPDPVVATGWWRKTTRLLGVDVFMKTTRKSGHKKERNPFSSTVVGNCKDFWGGDQPAWKVPKEGGVGLLRGRKVDWGRVYETPRMMGGGYGRGGRGDEEEGLM